MEDGPPIFRQDFSCPVLLEITHNTIFSFTGLSPTMARHFPESFTLNIKAWLYWAGPLSLAATKGISVDFFSSRYLDVSVPLVRFYTLCIQI